MPLWVGSLGQWMAGRVWPALRAQFVSWEQPGPWLLGSVLLAALALNAAWLARRSVTVRRYAATPWGEALAWLGSALFLALPPLGAWRMGAISAYYLGLTEIDWLDSLGAGGPIAALLVVVVLLGWLVYRRTLRELGYASAGQGTATSGMALAGRPPSAGPSLGERWRAPLDAALWQWHWAFYRAAGIAWLAALPAAARGGAASADVLSGPARLLAGMDPAAFLYWGAWLGLALAAVEWLLNPFARRRLTCPGEREAALRHAGLAVATTALFVLARNLWLCLACHIAIETAVAVWWPAVGRE